MGYADIGGGGSKLTWQLVVTGGYDFTHVIPGEFGYRLLSLDREEGDFKYDMGTGGWVAGVGFRW